MFRLLSALPKNNISSRVVYSFPTRFCSGSNRRVLEDEIDKLTPAQEEDKKRMIDEICNKLKGMRRFDEYIFLQAP